MLSFRCSCGLTKEREPTKQEHKKIDTHWRKENARSGALHKVYHSFVKKFKTENRWKKSGYDLMTSVEKWAETHPSVTVSGCDDNLFAGAILVFIPHESKDEYFGTTVVYLCQFGEPTEFFLYPCHVEGIMPIFEVMMKKSSKKPKPESLGFKF